MKLRIYSLNTNRELWFQPCLGSHSLRKNYPRFTDSCIVYEIEERKLLLINTLSGAADYIDGITAYELGMILAESGYKQQFSRIKQHFLSRGYLYKNKREEEFARRQMLKHYDRKKKRIQFFITLTTLCNFACPYCYQKDSLKTRRTISEKELVQCLEGIRQHAKSLNIPSEEITIVLYGGEPLLPGAKSMVAEACKVASEEGWVVGIITNGYTLVDYADLFLKYRKTIGRINVTLDGPESTHNDRRFLATTKSKGTFKKIIQGIKAISSLGIHLTINVNLDPANVDALKEFSSFIKRQSWTKRKNVHFLFSPIVDTFDKDIPTLSQSEESEIIPQLLAMHDCDYETQHESKFTTHAAAIMELESSKSRLPEPMTFGCSDLKRYVLHVDGKIYPCLDLSCIEKLSIGRWKPRWHISKQHERRFEHTSPLRLSKCRSCSMVSICGGPCPARYLLGRRKPSGRWCSGTDTAYANVIAYLENNKGFIERRLSSLRKAAIALDVDISD